MCIYKLIPVLYLHNDSSPLSIAVSSTIRSANRNLRYLGFINYLTRRMLAIPKENVQASTRLKDPIHAKQVWCRGSHHLHYQFNSLDTIHIGSPAPTIKYVTVDDNKDADIPMHCRISLMSILLSRLRPLRPKSAKGMHLGPSI